MKTRIAFLARVAIASGAATGFQRRRAEVLIDGMKVRVAANVPVVELIGAFWAGSLAVVHAWRVGDDAFVDLNDAATERAVIEWLDSRGVRFDRTDAERPVPMVLSADLYQVSESSEAA